jgi:hypothetical protein
MRLEAPYACTVEEEGAPCGCSCKQPKAERARRYMGDP